MSAMARIFLQPTAFIRCVVDRFDDISSMQEGSSALALGSAGDARLYAIVALCLA